MLLNVQFCIACTIQLSSMKSALTVVVVLAYVDYLSHRNGKILDLICCYMYNFALHAPSNFPQ